MTSEPSERASGALSDSTSRNVFRSQWASLTNKSQKAICIHACWTQACASRSLSLFSSYRGAPLAENRLRSFPIFTPRSKDKCDSRSSGATYYAEMKLILPASRRPTKRICSPKVSPKLIRDFLFNLSQRREDYYYYIQSNETPRIELRFARTRELNSVPLEVSSERVLRSWLERAVVRSRST